MKKNKLDRNIGMEMLRVTEAAAISSSRYMGSGDKEGGDGAAVNAMRNVLEKIRVDGVVVIGEGEKDNAPMLYNGEKVGRGKGAKVDVAVDPVEGTNLLAQGRANSIAILAFSERGSMWNPGSSFYMNKIVVEKKAKHAIDITKPVTENLEAIAQALDKSIKDITVFILDKERHQEIISDVRKMGARVTLQTDGDVMGALMAAIPGTGVDVLMGVGGTPEGVITAAAVKALGGGMQGMRHPLLPDEKKALAKDNVDLNEVLTLDTLINSEEAFFAATGITGGTFLNGVHFDREGGIVTHSIVTRASTGSVRYIEGIHQPRNVD